MGRRPGFGRRRQRGLAVTALLNVILGLLLIYLVFAIVVSRLQEWLSNALSSRGKFLRDGVHRMMGDSGLATRVMRHQLVSGLYRDRTARIAPPSYVEPASFALALANVLVRRGSPPEVSTRTTGSGAAKAEASTQQLSYQNLRAALASFSAQRSPIAEALLPVVDRAGDLDAALKGIEEWFAAGMDRVSGWYKTSARRRLFVIGFAVAALANVDSIEIFRSLNANPLQAARLAEVAEKLGKTGELGGVDVKALGDRPPNDKEWQALRTWLSSSVDMRALPIGWACLGAVTSPTGEDRTAVTVKAPEPTPKPQAAPAKPKAIPEDKAKAPAAAQQKPLSAWDRCGAEFHETATRMATADWFVKLLGWLLSAFAGSLGASYWFAAISKVINIRSSGPRPEPDKKK